MGDKPSLNYCIKIEQKAINVLSIHEKKCIYILFVYR